MSLGASAVELWQVLSIMGKGMAGIFIVIGALMISVVLLNRLTTKENRKGVD